MTNEPYIRQLPSNWQESRYDLAVGTVGYEGRARYIFETRKPRAETRAAAGFAEQQVLEYDINSSWFSDSGFTIAHISDGQYGEWIESLFEALPCTEHPPRILVDISSLTRVRLAHIIRYVCSSSTDLTVDFVYSLAAYVPPPAVTLLNSHVGPVLPEFAGWWDEPDRPLAAVVGLGYEQDKALGAVEHLQAAEAWIFTPVSEIKEYSPALVSANETLIANIKPERRMEYRVHTPFDCFMTLESLIYGLSRSRNSVLLPFGPKIFALCALLVAAVHPSTAVWRVSAGTLEEPVNRQASGYVYGLRVDIRPGRSPLPGRN
jgi:hypothetical protein